MYQGAFTAYLNHRSGAWTSFLLFLLVCAHPREAFVSIGKITVLIRVTLLFILISLLLLLLIHGLSLPLTQLSFLMIVSTCLAKVSLSYISTLKYSGCDLQWISSTFSPRCIIILRIIIIVVLFSAFTIIFFLMNEISRSSVADYSVSCF